MSLLRCPDCRRILDSKATACPGCGYPVYAVIKRVRQEVAQEVKVKDSVKSLSKETDYDQNLKSYKESRTYSKSSLWSIVGYLFIAGIAVSIVMFIIWISLEAGKTRKEMESLQSSVSSESVGGSSSADG